MAPRNPAPALPSAKAVLVLIALCAPIQAQREKRSSGWGASISGGILAFESIEDYEHLVESSTAEIEAFFRQLHSTPTSFRPLASNGNPDGQQRLADSEVDPFLAQILNRDAVVQIESYLIKVDTVGDRVLVLPTEHADRYIDLVLGNELNPYLRVFTTDEPVLERLRGQADARISKPGCTEDAAGSRTINTGWLSYSDPLGYGTVYFSGGLSYRKYGIYFSLRAECESQYWEPLQNKYVRTNHRMGIELDPVHYKVRCRGWVGPYTHYTASSGGGYHEYQSWQGSRPLSKYRMRARFSDVGVQTTGTSGWVQIRVNL